MGGNKAAKTDDLFGAAPGGQENIPKKAPPKDPQGGNPEGENGGNASVDGFENKFDD